MEKRCAICDEEIQEEYGKLKGTIIKVKNEKGEEQNIYVCSNCEKEEGYIEKAVIMGA